MTGNEKNSDEKICSVDGCGRRRHAKRLCSTHYSAWRIHHQPFPCSIEGCEKPRVNTELGGVQCTTSDGVKKVTPAKPCRDGSPALAHAGLKAVGSRLGPAPGASPTTTGGCITATLGSREHDLLPARGHA